MNRGIGKGMKRTIPSPPEVRAHLSSTSVCLTICPCVASLHFEYRSVPGRSTRSRHPGLGMVQSQLETGGGIERDPKVPSATITPADPQGSKDASGAEAPLPLGDTGNLLQPGRDRLPLTHHADSRRDGL